MRKNLIFQPTNITHLVIPFIILFVFMICITPAVYYPDMTYGTAEQIAPGVTWQTANNADPLWSIQILVIDMTNKNVELMPVFKAQGNIADTSNEHTSDMALRTDAIAAVNAGYYNTTNLMTNSYTEIDNIFIGGSGTNMYPENNRSVLGFSGKHQEITKRTKLSSSFVPDDPTDWDKIVDAIGGRGHFVTSGGVVITQDNEGTTSSHNATRHPRTVIGYTLSPYSVYLVTVDGRQDTLSVGMTYTELAQLMADLGVEQSISLDGGGSTTMWIKGYGIVNSPSDGSERSVVSSWVAVSANTMDNTVEEVTVNGTWTTDSLHSQIYYLDQLVTDDTVGSASVVWTPNLEEEGLYRVYAWWTSETSRVTDAPYEIIHADGTDIVTVDQTKNGAKWNVLGAYPFNVGTGVSVTLRNLATGTVSADAIRFVRICDIPEPIEPGYIITSTLFETDFETDQSSNFTVSQHIAGDNSIDFNYDYSTFAQQGGGHPTSIPQSPGSTGAGTKALRAATNLANGVVNGITATLTNIAPQDNIRITFDAWINYNGGSGGGSGSTEFMTFGASANSALVAMANSNYLTGTNQPFSGFFFGISGEGGASQDYRYYDGNGVGGATGNNASRANFLGKSAISESEFIDVFYPIRLFETPGVPGKSWNHFEINILNGKIRFIVTKPDGIEVILCDWFNPNSSATISGLLPHLGTMDVFSSLANPGQDNFVLYDNLKVETIVDEFSATATNWEMF